MNQSVQKESW